MQTSIGLKKWFQRHKEREEKREKRDQLTDEKRRIQAEPGIVPLITVPQKQVSFPDKAPIFQLKTSQDSQNVIFKVETII